MLHEKNTPASQSMEEITARNMLSLMLDTSLEISHTWSLEFIGACIHRFFTNLNLNDKVNVVLVDELLNGYLTIPGGQSENLSEIDNQILEKLTAEHYKHEHESILVFPLLSSTRCHGFVRVEPSKIFSNLSSDLQTKLEKFMHLVAVQIEMTQRLTTAERALGERDSQLIIMQEMGELISSVSDIEHLHEVIINMVKEVMNVHLCSMTIFDRDENGKETQTFIFLPEDKGRVDDEVISIWEHLGKAVKQEQRAILINNFEREGLRYLPMIPKTLRFPFLSAPLRINQKVVGVIHVCNKFLEDAFSTSDHDFISTFSNQVSKALENAKLHQDLKSFALMTISSLISAIETKDPFMKGHSERVAFYSKRLAMAIEPALDQNAVTMIEYAAILHDIGKIGIAKEILHKKAPLLEQEVQEIKKHPSLGKKILRPLKFLEEAGTLIDHHQERYDGSGYPDGLAGKNIPLGARIIAIADSFDAMTSVRPYRNKLSMETTRKELLENSGKQFDPDLVTEFIRLVDEGLFEEIINRSEDSDSILRE